MEAVLLNSLALKLRDAENPYLTKETLVIREFTDMCDNHFKVSWLALHESVRQGQCFMGRNLHLQLAALREKVGGEDDLFERILSRDYVRPTDLTKLANMFTSKMNGPLANDSDFLLGVYTFFGVDGFKEELKRYVDNFKWNSDVRVARHVAAVRRLYGGGYASRPAEIKCLLENIFKEIEKNNDSSKWSEACKVYAETIGEYLHDVMQLKMKKEQMKKDEGLEKVAQKRKRIVASEGKKVKKLKILKEKVEKVHEESTNEETWPQVKCMLPPRVVNLKEKEEEEEEETGESMSEMSNSEEEM